MNRFLKIVFLFTMLFFQSMLLTSHETHLRMIQKGIPEWMNKQIQDDLKCFEGKTIHVGEFNRFIAENNPSAKLTKFTIKNNKVLVEKDYNNHVRTNAIRDSLTKLCQTVGLPDVVLMMTQHDGRRKPSDIPLFVMSKVQGSEGLILMPDFHALQAKYQVLEGIDITRQNFPWSNKIAKLTWRGSTAQHPTTRGTTGIMCEDNLHLYSRVTLCNLSLKYPDLINAKFTRFLKGTRDIPQLQKLKGSWLPFEEEINYKYHIMIDGTASSYSLSGWKFFINSVVFKEDSEWIQWYYKALIPNTHFVLVETNLTNLIEKLEWAKNNDEQAEKIAKASTKFARTHITVEHNLAYLYWLVQAYSKLHFGE